MSFDEDLSALLSRMSHRSITESWWDGSASIVIAHFLHLFAVLSRNDEIKEQVPVTLKELNDIEDVKSDLAKTLLEGSQAELMISIADAAEASEIREIRYFTQRSVFSRRILEI